MAIVTPQHREIPNELVEAVQRTLAGFPAAAAAFVWAWEGDSLHVHVVIEDQLVGTHACTREIQAHFPDVTVNYEYWEKWHPRDDFGGYERVYLRQEDPFTGRE